MPRACFLFITTIALAAGCGGRSRGTTPGDDAGPVDARVGGDGGVACGATVCAPGLVCCTDCDGNQSCGEECAGIACPPGDCRSDDDCMGGTSWEYCLPPGEPPACGVGCMMMRDCEAHADCGEGSRCVQYRGGCCASTDPLSSRCLPACTEASCAEGERCNTEGICEPIPCSDGWSCPAYTSCTGTGDGHGCSRNTCATDADCAGGYCVNGACHPGLGTCTPPSA